MTKFRKILEFLAKNWKFGIVQNSLERLLIGSRHNINNILATPKVFVGDTPLKRVRETKALGVYIDEFLS